MRTIIAVAALFAVLAAPSGALAQGGSPFQPLPPAPQEVPEESLPTDTASTEDDDFSALEWLLLGGVATLLLGGVAWAIAREGGGFQRGRRRRRAARSSEKPRKATTASGASPSSGRGEAKPPPPPPRKRQSAAAKRRAKGKGARTKAKRR